MAGLRTRLYLFIALSLSLGRFNTVYHKKFATRKGQFENKYTNMILGMFVK